MGEMRAFVCNSNEEFELEGPVKSARDPVCGEALKGGGAGAVAEPDGRKLEAYTEKMTIRFAAFSDKVEELLKSDFIDVVYVQTQDDLYRDEKVIKEIQETMESGAP